MTNIDATIGKSIRHYRWLQGVSQADLAAALGISEAQMRSHEAGKSRVSAARLLVISEHLGVDVTAFFKRQAETQRSTARIEVAPVRGPGDAIQSGKYLAALMTHFQRLNDTQKQAVLHLVVSISKEDTDPRAEGATKSAPKAEPPNKVLEHSLQGGAQKGQFDGPD